MNLTLFNSYSVCLEMWNAATLPSSVVCFLLHFPIALSVFSVCSSDWSANSQYCCFLNGSKQVGAPGVNTCLQSFNC